MILIKTVHFLLCLLRLVTLGNDPPAESGSPWHSTSLAFDPAVAAQPSFDNTHSWCKSAGGSLLAVVMSSPHIKAVIFDVRSHAGIHCILGLLKKPDYLTLRR